MPKCCSLSVERYFHLLFFSYASLVFTWFHYIVCMLRLFFLAWCMLFNLLCSVNNLVLSRICVDNLQSCQFISYFCLVLAVIQYFYQVHHSSVQLVSILLTSVICCAEFLSSPVVWNITDQILFGL